MQNQTRKVAADVSRGDVLMLAPIPGRVSSAWPSPVSGRTVIVFEDKSTVVVNPEHVFVVLGDSCPMCGSVDPRVRNTLNPGEEPGWPCAGSFHGAVPAVAR